MQQGSDNLTAQRRVAFVPYAFTLQAAARLQLGDFAEAQTLIEAGTSLAQETGQAVGLRFRAEMSLARLRASTERQAEAKSILAAGYDRFTEGFETRDLRVARVLLGSL